MPDGKARDHLANERTFLAWARTALGLLGLGFVLARVGLFLRELAPHGAGVTPAQQGREFVVSGVVVLFVGVAFGAWGGVSYARTRRAIELDRYEPAGASVAALAAVVVLGGLALAALVVWRMAPAGTLTP